MLSIKELYKVAESDLDTSNLRLKRDLIAEAFYKYQIQNKAKLDLSTTATEHKSKLN
jgi:hypothetical protein